MTRKKQPWGEQRSWIVPADGSPPQELASKDYYHRHLLNPEGVSVYVLEGQDAESLPESIKNEIQRQLKGQL